MKRVQWFLSLFLPAAVIATAISPAGAQESVPLLINYEAELTSPSTGEPVPGGDYDMVFSIYDVEFGGTPLWQGAHSSGNGNPVQVKKGILSVLLGSGAGNAIDASLFNGADRWLEIGVGTETLEPRQRITSVAYSMVSENSRLLGGKESSEFAAASHTHAGTEITSGVLPEERVDPTITRDGEVMSILRANDGSGSALDADLLDGKDSGEYAGAQHSHAGADITSGSVAEARIDSTIARDSEIMPTVLATDGSGSGLDADTLDGHDAGDFVLKSDDGSYDPAGTWIVNTHTGAVSTMTVAPESSGNGRFGFSSDSVNFDPTLGGLLPQASPLQNMCTRGDLVRTGLNTYDYSFIFYNRNELREVVYILIARGYMVLTDADTYEDTCTKMSWYSAAEQSGGFGDLPNQDMNDDGLPDEGQEPFFSFQGNAVGRRLEPLLP